MTKKVILGAAFVCLAVWMVLLIRVLVGLLVTG